MRPSIPVALAVSCLAATPSPSMAATGVRLVAEPAAALLDAPVTLRVEGLRPGEPATLTASTSDAMGRAWRSEASFRADARGVVDPAAAASEGGTYAGVDAMGLLWSLRPEPAAASPATSARAAPIQDLLIAPAGVPFPRPISGALEVALEVRVAGTPAATGRVTRYVTGTGVSVTEVREQGLVARVYEPHGGKRPAVLVLGGSHGGVPALYAPVLAGHGYVTLGLAYFRAEGLPNDLVEIPVEYPRRGPPWIPAASRCSASRAERRRRCFSARRSLSDRMWPAAAMSDRIAEALRARRFPYRVEQLQYDGLAHAPPDAWLPAPHGGTFGGTAEGTMRAYAHYWPALLAFLEGSLRAPR